MKLAEYVQDLSHILERTAVDYSSALKTAQEIIQKVQSEGDDALNELTEKYDGKKIRENEILVGEDEIRKAYNAVDEEIVKALQYCRESITVYHQRQYDTIKKDWMIKAEKGVEVGERTTPLKSAGCYVPGGKAVYPSTVLMTVIPAKIAGVERIVVTTPPDIDPVILVACDLAGADEIYRAGGAQAIAALAHGTETIKPVDKIVGPGNRYVTAAKMLCYGKVDVDMPAGPSEVLIIADEQANPEYVMWDLLAQAEHDENAQAILVTDSRNLAEEVKKQLEKQIRILERKKILETSQDNIYAVITNTMQESVEFANTYGAEHLVVNTQSPEKISDKIHNAGAIFLGEYATVAAGDYASGANHVLPTGGAARYSSQLSVRDFLKTTSIQKIDKKGLETLSEAILALSKAEGLEAHGKSVSERLR